MRIARKTFSWKKLLKVKNDKSIYMELWKRKLITQQNVYLNLSSIATVNMRNDVNNNNNNFICGHDSPAYRESEEYKKLLEELEGSNEDKNAENNENNNDNNNQIFNHNESCYKSNYLRQTKHNAPARYRSTKEENKDDNKGESDADNENENNNGKHANENKDKNSKQSTQQPSDKSHTNNSKHTDNNKQTKHNKHIKNKKAIPLTLPTMILLKSIENHASFDDIMYYRSLVEKEIALSLSSVVSTYTWVQGLLSW